MEKEHSKNSRYNQLAEKVFTSFYRFYKAQKNYAVKEKNKDTTQKAPFFGQYAENKVGTLLGQITVVALRAFTA